MQKLILTLIILFGIVFSAGAQLNPEYWNVEGKSACYVFKILPATTTADATYTFEIPCSNYTKATITAASGWSIGGTWGAGVDKEINLVGNLDDLRSGYAHPNLYLEEKTLLSDVSSNIGWATSYVKPASVAAYATSEITTMSRAGNFVKELYGIGRIRVSITHPRQGTDTLIVTLKE